MKSREQGCDIRIAKMTVRDFAKEAAKVGGDGKAPYLDELAGREAGPNARNPTAA